MGQKPSRSEIIASAKVTVTFPFISVVAAFPQALAQHIHDIQGCLVLVAVDNYTQFGAQELTASRHMTAH